MCCDDRRSSVAPNDRRAMAAAATARSLHPVNAALAAAATLVAVAFSLSTLDRWLRRRRPYELAWTISLALFATGAAALWWAETRGWSLASFRVFFLAGAVLNVPWLALGTVYLLAGRPPATGRAAWLLVPQRAGHRHRAVRPDHGRGRRQRAAHRQGRLRRRARACSPRSFSGLPALVIIGGALWSAVRLVRHRPPALPGVGERPARPAAGARQPADRRRHAGALGQRHARRSPRQGPGVRRHPARRDRRAVRRVPRGQRTGAAHRAARRAAADDLGADEAGTPSRYTSATRSNFPLTFFGRESTNRIFVGHLYRARWSRHQSIRASSSTLVPSCSTT